MREVPPGRLEAFVGPSGVGKDVLIRAVHAALPATHAVCRTITREADAAGEPCDAATPEEFRRREAAGEFLLSWEAHGLCYGIPATVAGRLAGGQDCLVNLSRAVLAEAAAKVPELVVLSITAAPEVLAQRLAGARPRERGGNPPPSRPGRAGAAAGGGGGERRQ
jgi:ribose 1,5-bisphosphokinase